MTKDEADAIITDARGRLGGIFRDPHWTNRTEFRGYSLQDAYNLLAHHEIEAEPEPNPGFGEYTVRLLGQTLDGRNARLIVGINEVGTCRLISMQDADRRRKRRRQR